MPLFVNNRITPKVYNHSPKINEKNNQEIFQLKYLNEILAHQQESTVELSNNLALFSDSLTESKTEQSNQYSSLSSAISRQENLSQKLIANFSEQRESSTVMREKLLDLEENQKKLGHTLSNGELTSQVMLDQLASQQAAINELQRKLVKYEDVAKALSLQTENQEKLHKLILEQGDLQRIFHNTVMETLGKHEVMDEKITGELSDIKTNLTNKINSILEKVEELQTKISQFLFNFLFQGMIRQNKIKKD